MSSDFLPKSNNITVIEHSVVQDLVTRWRDVTTDEQTKEAILRQLGIFLAYESMRNHPLRQENYTSDNTGFIGNKLAYFRPDVLCFHQNKGFIFLAGIKDLLKCNEYFSEPEIVAMSSVENYHTRLYIVSPIFETTKFLDDLLQKLSINLNKVTIFCISLTIPQYQLMITNYPEVQIFTTFVTR